MKLIVEFKELEGQRERIGANLSSWNIHSSSLDPREQLLFELGKGIEIKLNEVDVGPGPLLTYKGEQVILYIKDTGSSLWTLKNEPEKSRRFHIAECQTLESMRSAGRFERYVVTNRMDGVFLVDWLDPESYERGETEAELKVCKNCLSCINWRGYETAPNQANLLAKNQHSKRSIWNEFLISEFLMDYSTFFHSRPSRLDINAELNAYVSDWQSISERRKRNQNWSCESCHVNLSELKGYSIHCHHLSGVVTDNSDRNLKVLCAICHSKQPFHHRMKVPTQLRSKIEHFKIEQGLRLS
jgi:hypothetical protein